MALCWSVLCWVHSGHSNNRCLPAGGQRTSHQGSCPRPSKLQECLAKGALDEGKDIFQVLATNPEATMVT